MRATIQRGVFCTHKPVFSCGVTHSDLFTYMYSGNAVVTYGMATVIIDGLACGVTYNIIAGGTLNGDLIGPRSSHGTTTTGPCPPMIITNTTDTASMTGKELELRTYTNACIHMYF